MFFFRKNIFGFTLIEVLITIAIIGVITTLAFVALSSSKIKAGDKLRIAELDRLGRILQSAGGSIDNYLSGLPIEGDLNILIDEAENKAGFKIFGQRPQDPNAPTGQTGFRYIIDNGDIVIYANLQDLETEVTLSYSQPTPGGGSGVLQGTGVWSSGLNRTDRYYQVSN